MGSATRIVTTQYLTEETRFDRAEIMRQAHFAAQRYARLDGSYRKALSAGLKAAWAQARCEMTAYVMHGPARLETAAERAIRLEVLSLEMKDRMNAADFARLDALAIQRAGLRQMAA